MIEISVAKGMVNVNALSAELQAAIGSISLGFSSGEGQVIVYLADDATQAQQDQARAIVEAHDPTQLTPEQQARAQRQQELEQLRQANTTVLDLSAYDREAEPLQQLAQKVAWLELEFRVSRGE